eukprot:63979-Prorocentrum_minimum.AAC.3
MMDQSDAVGGEGGGRFRRRASARAGFGSGLGLDSGHCKLRVWSVSIGVGKGTVRVSSRESELGMFSTRKLVMARDWLLIRKLVMASDWLLIRKLVMARDWLLIRKTVVVSFALVNPASFDSPPRFWGCRWVPVYPPLLLGEANRLKTSGKWSADQGSSSSPGLFLGDWPVWAIRVLWGGGPAYLFGPASCQGRLSLPLRHGCEGCGEREIVLALKIGISTALLKLLQPIQPVQSLTLRHSNGARRALRERMVLVPRCTSSDRFAVAHGRSP